MKKKKKQYLDTHDELEDHIGYHAILEERSRKLQNRVSDIIKALEFDEKESDKSLLKAIAFFTTTGGNVTVKLPMEFLGEEEKNSLLQSTSRRTVSDIALQDVSIHCHRRGDQIRIT